MTRDSNNECLPSISNTNVSIFLVSQHNEPINSTSIHICRSTLVVFPQIILLMFAMLNSLQCMSVNSRTEIAVEPQERRETQKSDGDHAQPAEPTCRTQTVARMHEIFLGESKRAGRWIALCNVLIWNYSAAWQRKHVNVIETKLSKSVNGVKWTLMNATHCDQARKCDGPSPASVSDCGNSSYPHVIQNSAPCHPNQHVINDSTQCQFSNNYVTW